MPIRVQALAKSHVTMAGGADWQRVHVWPSIRIVFVYFIDNTTYILEM